MLCTATPDILSSRENINSTARVPRLSFCFLWLCLILSLLQKSFLRNSQGTLLLNRATIHDHPQPPTTNHNFVATTHKLPLFYHRHPRLWTLLKNELFRNYFSTTLHRLIQNKLILICKSIDWFLWKQQVGGFPWFELFVKFKISKEITWNFSKIFKSKELILVTLQVFFL